MEKHEWVQLLKGSCQRARNGLPVDKTGDAEFDNQFSAILYEIEEYARSGWPDFSISLQRFRNEKHIWDTALKLDVEYGLRVCVYGDWMSISGWSK